MSVLFAALFLVFGVALKVVHDLLTLYNAPKSLLAFVLIAGGVVEVATGFNSIRNGVGSIAPRNGAKWAEVLAAVISRLPGQPPSAQSQRAARQWVLRAVEREWIGYVHAQNEEQLQLQIQFVRSLSHARTPSPTLHAGTTEARSAIQELYANGAQQLLILGAAGSGKTTLMLQLGSDLLNYAKKNGKARIPVYFQLSNWRPNHKDLATWLVDELAKDPYGAKEAVGRNWVGREEAVIPLLDGLDEVAVKDQLNCVAAINAYHDQHRQLPMVVTCRLQAYESLTTKLALRDAIEVEPLTATQVDEYLAHSGANLGLLRATAASDEQLTEMLRNPFVLLVAVATYRSRPAAVATVGSAGALRDQLLSDYVDQCLSRWPSSDPKHSVRHWLGYLARYMSGRNDADEARGTFHLDLLQLDALPSSSQRTRVRLALTCIWSLACSAIAVAAALVTVLLSILLPALGLPRLWNLSVTVANVVNVDIRLPDDAAAAILLALVLGAPIGAYMGWSTSDRISVLRPISISAVRKVAFFSMAAGVVGAVLFVAVLGPTGAMLVAWIDPDIKQLFLRSSTASYGQVAISLCNGIVAAVTAGGITRLTLRQGTTLGLWVGFSYGLAISIVGWQTAQGPWIVALTLGWIFGVSVGAVVGLEPPAYTDPPAPGMAMQAAKRNAVIGAISGMVIGSLVIAPVVWLLQSARSDVVHANLYSAAFLSVTFGLLVGVLAAIYLGGASAMSHRLLLWSLKREGLAPSDYQTLLQNATRVVILRRIGGGYQFLHGLLQAWFTNQS